jgi:hypothetical protein
MDCQAWTWLNLPACSQEISLCFTHSSCKYSIEEFSRKLNWQWEKGDTKLSPIGIFDYDVIYLLARTANRGNTAREMSREGKKKILHSSFSPEPELTLTRQYVLPCLAASCQFGIELYLTIRTKNWRLIICLNEKQYGILLLEKL